MADKVQAKPDASDTSFFHHGLIKLLVVEELNMLNRNWLTFLCLNGYELDTATPSRRTPKSKSITPREEQQQEEEKQPKANQQRKVEQPIVEAFTSTKRLMIRR